LRIIIYLSLLTAPSLISTSLFATMPKKNLLPCCIPSNRRKKETQAETNAKAVAKRRDTVDKQAQDLEALQFRRPRALTLPLPSNTVYQSKATQTIVDQLPSLFLAELPLEVRRLIYAEVLGGKRFHMSVHPKDGRLAHFRCILPNKGDGRRSNIRCLLSRNATYPRHCWSPMFPNGMNTLQFQTSDLPVNWGLLTLLRTCRLV